MADGNFNRSPLATNSYQSGVRAGKATMRTLALNAFAKHIEENFKNASDEEKQTLLETFKACLK
ncbi:MAG: hypothetical protein J6R79_02445 [Bacteroidaceae bacterium]|nr:hypothetical protein [Bacteroidaceae bacterium]